jgi:hypothetical protein
METKLLQRLRVGYRAARLLALTGVKVFDHFDGSVSAPYTAAWLLYKIV